VVGGADEGVALLQLRRDLRQVGEGLDLPGQVVEADGGATGADGPA
jgi:hypothetical protein